MSESNIYEQLRKAQVALKAPKSEAGRFGKSRSAEAILEAAKPVLAKNDLTLVVSDEIILIGDRHYVKATATVYDDEGNSIPASANAWEGEIDRGLDPSQVTGKTSSYARKYALGGLLAIDDTKDADTSNDAPAASPPAKKPAVGSAAPTPPRDASATEIQKRQIRAFLQGLSVPDNEMPDYLEENFGFVAGTKMTKEDATMILRELRELRYPTDEGGEEPAEDQS